LGRSLEVLTNLRELSLNFEGCEGLPPHLQVHFHNRAELASALAATAGAGICPRTHRTFNRAELYASCGTAAGLSFALAMERACADLTPDHAVRAGVHGGVHKPAAAWRSSLAAQLRQLG